MSETILKGEKKKNWKEGQKKSSGLFCLFNWLDINFLGETFSLAFQIL